VQPNHEEVAHVHTSSAMLVSRCEPKLAGLAGECLGDPRVGVRLPAQVPPPLCQCTNAIESGHTDRAGLKEAAPFLCETLLLYWVRAAQVAVHTCGAGASLRYGQLPRLLGGQLPF
jgi:hypothetical protein